MGQPGRAEHVEVRNPQLFPAGIHRDLQVRAIAVLADLVLEARVLLAPGNHPKEFPNVHGHHYARVVEVISNQRVHLLPRAKDAHDRYGTMCEFPIEIHEPIGLRNTHFSACVQSRDRHLGYLPLDFHGIVLAPNSHIVVLDNRP